MKLKKEFKRAWIEALRSGKYEQGFGQLATITYDGSCEFCCLGVAAAISGMNVDDMMSKTLPPPEVGAEWWEERPEDDKLVSNPPVYLDGDMHTLSDANDFLQLSFNEIADIIEEQL